MRIELIMKKNVTYLKVGNTIIKGLCQLQGCNNNKECDLGPSILVPDTNK